MVRATGSALVIVDAKKALNMVNGLITNIPKGARLGSKAIASKYAQIYLNQMPQAGITQWTGRSFAVLRRQITNPIRTGRNEYAVVVPSTLIMLDSMRPHVVALKKGRSISRWAKAKLGLEGLVATKITVHPHPWIVEANRKARQFIRRLAEREINKKLRRKGKR